MLAALLGVATLYRFTPRDGIFVFIFIIYFVFRILCVHLLRRICGAMSEIILNIIYGSFVDYDFANMFEKDMHAPLGNFSVRFLTSSVSIRTM